MLAVTRHSVTIEPYKQRGNKMTTMLTYTSKTNNFDYVLIKSDDSFVVVGDAEVSDLDLAKMTNWEDVEGWEAE